MMRLKFLPLAGLLAAFASVPAAACGYCVEDKVASVYDHAVVTAAAARRHQVVFFAIDGRLAGKPGEALALERIAGAAHGVDAGTVRVNVETASLSAAFDPKTVPLATLQRFLQRKMAPRGLELLPLRIMDGPAAMKLVARP